MALRWLLRLLVDSRAQRRNLGAWACAAVGSSAAAQGEEEAVRLAAWT